MSLLGLFVIVAFVGNMWKLSRTHRCKPGHHKWKLINRHKMVCQECKAESLPMFF